MSLSVLNWALGKKSLVTLPHIMLSGVLPFETRAALDALRAQADRQHATFVEGLMLKRRAGAYVPGRPKGEWYKWKRDPMMVNS